MKRILLPLLLLFAFAANAQIKLFYQLMAGPYEFTYTNIPSRPTLGTSATLTYSAPGNILNTTGGTTQDKILSGAWTEFHAFSFTGSAGTNRRISNENSSTVIGSVANHLFTKEGTGSTYFELNGKSSTEPLYFDDVGAVSATSAIQLTADAAGPYAYITNIVNDARGYAVFANTAGTLSGGNSTTPTTSSTNYQDLSISYVRSFNATGNKEHLYLGATTTNTYAIHQNIDISHCLGYQSEWDGMQIQNAINFTVDHVTIVDAGSDGTASQDANIQVQNSYGSVTNSIFTGAPQGFRFSTFNLTFTNNYVQWDGNKANEIIGYYTNYASTNRLMVDPTTVEILIDGCDFVATTWTGALMDVQDANVNITVQNCRIQGPTSLFSDSRGGSPTGTLTDGGGNTFVGSGTIPAPTFSNFTATDFDGHGLLTEQTHHQANRGYRTQN
jgi:hypothetical protein